MEDIKVGEYIRTKSGVIIKADYISFDKLRISQKGLGYDFEDIDEMKDFIKNEVIKHSKNIIDLIEVGDVIVDKNNRIYEITEIKVYEDMGICLMSKFSIGGNTYFIEFGESDIKKILTKEMFENNCYKVGE